MEMINQSVQLVLRMLKITIPAMFIVQYMRAAGWLNCLDRYAFSIVRFTGFDKEIGHAFLASLGSAHAGNGLLIDRFRQKQLTLSGMVLGSVYISLATHVRLVITFTIPAAFSLLPLRVAIAYTGFILLNGFIKCISAGVISHFVRIYPDKSEKTDPVTAETPDENKPISVVTAPWKSALKMTWKISSKAVFFAFCSSLLIQWLDHQGAFNALPLDPTLFGIPQESLKILAAWFAHVYAGMGMAGQMTTNGDFSQLEVFRTCLFCAIASRPIFFIKEAPGYYFGLFGPKVGLCLFAYHMSALLINGSIVLFLTGLYH